MIEVFATKLLSKDDFLYRKSEFINRLPVTLGHKFGKYSHNDNLQRSLLGELLSRRYFVQKYNLHEKQIIYSYGTKGKPYFPESTIHFNISHSGEWVVVAFAENHIGIDVELIREPNYEVAKRYFSQAEINQLNLISDIEEKKNLFFDFWTIKESYLKAIGTGLTKALNTFTVVKTNSSILLRDNENYDQVYIKQYEFDRKYKLSVCGFENEFADIVKIVRFI